MRAKVRLTQAAIEIHRAASDGNVEKVSELLKNDPSLLESRDEIGMTPLLVAARDGKVNVVTFLIEKGADIKATTKMGNYDALSLAAKNGQKDVVLILPDIFNSKKKILGVNMSHNQVVVVNGKEQRLYSSIISIGGGKILFDSPAQFHYLAETGDIIYLVEETLKQQ